MTTPSNHPPLLTRINWYWVFQLAGWNIMALLTLMGLAHNGASWAVIGVCWWGAATGLGLSILWRRWLRRQSWVARHFTWQRILPACVVLAVVQSALVATGYIALRPFGAIRDFDWLPFALISWFSTFLVWTILYSMIVSLRRATQLEAETLRLQLHGREAELRALQAQINPHFFFNSLNSVRALMFEDREAAARMIDQLANLMRHALQSSQHATVPLAAELDAVHAYLAIEQSRFEERMRVSFAIEISAPDLEHVRVPPMALQTLVENAVKYGVEASADGGDIRIAARRSSPGDGAAMLQIEVANTGALREPGNSTCVGLRNARQRLQLACGERSSLELREQAGWVFATIHLPEQA
ncbi:sensor histidine kinase [Janthinobacterium sp. GB4P2]|uniref:sensor histidine kinase n=1 Tax=Janthinobacterium sp. GB4P2 TaxID=3424189 RepID=UPI003F21DD0C